MALENARASKSHEYGAVTIGGQARLHQGDTIINDYSTNTVVVGAQGVGANNPPSRLFSVPFRRDTKFVDRPAIFSDILSAAAEHRPAVICGLGGTGKSQIAIEYAYRFVKHFPESYVIWIFAASRQTIIQGCQDTARNLGLLNPEPAPSRDACSTLFDWFNQSKSPASSGQWLIVLDNLDSPAVLSTSLSPTTSNHPEDDHAHRYLLDYLPQDMIEGQQLLVTTRSQDVAYQFESPPIELGVFDILQARQLFKNRLHVNHSQIDLTTMDALLARLDLLPLAISQAAAYIARNRVSPQQYLSRLNEDDRRQADYLSVDIQDPRRPKGWPSSVYLSWKISFDEIRRTQPLAFRFLSLIAFLDEKQIPRDLLQRRGSLLQNTEEIELDVWDEEMPQAHTQADIDMAFGTLLGYSLVNSGQSPDLLTAHSLVSACIRNWIFINGDPEQVSRAVFVVILEHANADGVDVSDFLNVWAKRWSPLATHARTALRYCQGHGPATLEQGFAMLLLCLWEAWEGSFDAGLEWMRTAQELFGKIAWRYEYEERIIAGFTIVVAKLIASVLDGLGRQEERHQVLQDTLEIWEEKLPTRDLIDLCQGSVNALVEMKRLDEAEVIVKNINTLAECLEPRDEYALASAQAMFAEVAMARKEFAEAEKHILEAIELASVNGTSFGSQAWTQQSLLSKVMLRTGKPESALDVLNRGLLLDRQVTEWPKALQASMHYRLGVVLWCIRRYEAAHDAFQVLTTQHKQDAILCGLAPWAYYENLLIGLEAERNSISSLGPMPDPWLMKPNRQEPNTISYWNYMTEEYRTVDPRLPE